MIAQQSVPGIGRAWLWTLGDELVAVEFEITPAVGQGKDVPAEVTRVALGDPAGIAR